MTEATTTGTATHDREALAADLRTLLEHVETVHADPFVGYEDRTALHARGERLVRELPAELTVEAFYRRAAPVVAGLADAHSLLRAPEHDDPAWDRRLPLGFRVVEDALYVERVAAAELTRLLGGRLVAVAGVPVETLRERARRYRGAENRYGRALLAAGQVERAARLTRLLEHEHPPASLSVTVAVGPDDEHRSRTVSLQDPAATDETAATLPETVAQPVGTGPRYRLLADGEAVVFDPGNLSDYRESLEAKLAVGADVAAEQATRAHERQVDGPVPEDVEATVSALPAMTETLQAMAADMAAADTGTLVVDLRDNPGGDSQFALHLAYLLAGWTGVARAVEGVRVLRRRSPAYRERYGAVGGTGDDETADTVSNPADYDLAGYLPPDDGTEDGEVPALARQLLGRSATSQRFLETTTPAELYAPPAEGVVVAVSAGTMSSAFACAAQLRALGADVVGVPPGQGPVSFGEAVRVELPNTGLGVRLAGSRYRWVADPSGPVLEPDRSLTRAAFERRDRAGDAGLHLALEHAGVPVTTTTVE